MRRHRSLSEAFVGAVVYPAWARKEHRAYAAFRRELEKTQFLAPPALQQLQAERLSALLTHAITHCPFYRRRLQAAGVGPQTGPLDAAWLKLPLTTKADLQQHGGDMQAHNIPAAAKQRNQTGGSTAAPVQFYVDRARFSTRMASTNRHNAWAGLKPGDWLATVWGAPLEAHGARGWRERLTNRCLYRSINLNTSSVGPEDWDRFFSALRRHRPRWLLAYASGALELAQEVERRQAADVKFGGIITSAEVLTPAQRQRIEQALGGPVFNRYGCREVSVMASECDQHQGLHVNAEALLIEIVPVPGMEPGWGKVAVTDLLNRAQPLIRYENGDIARWAEGSCPCGRGLPRLAEVQGRVADFIHLPGGRMISGVAVLTLALADVRQVHQLQLVDRGPGDLELRVVPGIGFGPAVRRELAERLQRHLQGAARLEITEVAAIPRSASGKYQFVVHDAAPAAKELAC